jgi:outer membrane protein assembly factor BamB
VLPANALNPFSRQAVAHLGFLPRIRQPYLVVIRKKWTMWVFGRELGLIAVRAALFLALAALSASFAAQSAAVDPAVAQTLQQISINRGVCAVVGLPESGGPALVVGLARESELTVYFQSSQAEEVAAVRKAAVTAGLLGRRVFVEHGENRTIHLADNLADALLVAPVVERALDEAELLRALHPGAVAIVDGRRLVKPQAKGVDQWSHVFHGPDNNPLSTDQLARAPYLTQFLADPKFCPMPEVSVAAGGRVFRAFGHLAHLVNQNALLNTLLCINAYNGTILWRRPLREGYMIHRNTMIATPEVLYLADNEACKLIDARTGQVKDQIVITEGTADGRVWKWMGLEPGTDGRAVLYALVGGEEIRPKTTPSQRDGLGHWPWGMWEGHDYKDPKANFGFGRTLLAIDPATKKILWAHSEEDYIDARAVCLKNGRIYCYSPGKFVACVSAASGEVVWKNSDQDLLGAIGRDGPAQFWVMGYASMPYLKCNDRYLFFAGPQRDRLVVAAAKDGKLAWQKRPGNLQLVLRDDAVYCAGPERLSSSYTVVYEADRVHATWLNQNAPQKSGFKLAYDTGEELGLLPARRACTRATGTVDSIFYRGAGTVRLDLASNTVRQIAPMRPPCQDGVIVSDGYLYWGPWMCGCQLSLYGHICLGPAGNFNSRPARDSSRLVTAAGDPSTVKPFDVQPGDWPTYLGDNARSAVTKVHLPDRVTRRWSYQVPGQARPTAPVIAGGMVFLGDENGVVRALDAESGSIRWQADTSGAVFFPPALWQGRLYVGSADGRVYAFEAATGRFLWSFRAAPADRWIAVYGKLLSTWPVAGGVVAADGVVYAAAGIAHYDGTYVYALDAVTGQPKWCNDSSGNLSQEVDCGISLQGPLYIAAGQLRFLGGNKYETACYELETGKCLNEPDNTLAARSRTAFYPYYPEYGRYMLLDYHLADGKDLVYDVSYEGASHTPLALYAPLAPGTQRVVKREARWPLNPSGEPRRTAVWSDKTRRRFHSFVVAANMLLAAGHSGSGESEEPFLAAIDTSSGSDLWREALPAAAVKAGTAVDRQGRIVVALENGQIVTLK